MMKFVEIFAQLEDARSKGRVKDYSIFSTTLEQIFMKLAKCQISSD